MTPLRDTGCADIMMTIMLCSSMGVDFRTMTFLFFLVWLRVTVYADLPKMTLLCGIKYADIFVLTLPCGIECGGSLGFLGLALLCSAMND